jgi:outer membrane protein assembly factor BamE
LSSSAWVIVGVARIRRIIASAAFAGAAYAMRPLLLFLAAVVLGGCSSTQSTTDRLLGIITPYRIDIMQGNVVTKEQAALVRPGMSREQVRDLLGSPLLASAFHADRWDYVFTLRRQGVEPQRRNVVAYFKNDKLERIEAPDLPSETEFVASVRPARRGGTEPALALTDDQKRALPAPVRSEAPAVTAPQGAAREYPPLEPS